jgi:uncharacterized protein YggE
MNSGRFHFAAACLAAAVVAIGSFGARAPALALPQPVAIPPLQSQAPQPAPNSLEVSADGEYRADPDTAIINFDIEGKASQVAAAYADAQRQAEQVRALLRANGIAPSAAHLTTYQVEPDTDWRTRKITGYTVTAEIILETRDFSKLGPILGQAGAEGMPALRSVTFTLGDLEQAKANAVADAYRKAHAAGEVLAKAAGVRLGTLIWASVDVHQPSPIRPMIYARTAMLAAAPAPTAEFTPQQIKVTAHVHAIIRLEQ